MLGLSLRTRLLLGTTGLVVVLGLALIVAVQTTLADRLLAELHRRGVTITRNMARESVDLILTERTVDLQIAANDYQTHEEDIEYVFVLNPRGDVLVHTFENGFPTDLRGVNSVGSEESYRIQPLDTERGRIFDIAVPVLGGEVGVVRVGISDKNVQRGVADITGLSSAIIVVVLSAGGGIASLLGILLMRPILELTEAARRIGEGDLERRVRVTTKDEIGQLGATFNRMIEDLSRATASFRSVVQSADDGIILADADGNITQWNKGAESILGYSEEEVLGKPLTLLMPEQHRGAHQEALARASEAGRHQIDRRTVELHGLTKGGVEKPLELSLAIWESGGETFHGGIIRDITDRKQMAQELEEQRVKAMQADRLHALGEMAAGMAHELNQPLGVISTTVQDYYLRLTEGREISEEQWQVVMKQLMRTSDMMSGTVSHLRMLSRDTSKVSSVRYGVNEVIEASLSLVGTQLRSHEIDVRLDLWEDLPAVSGHPGRLEQVFLNLLGNARDALDEKGADSVPRDRTGDNARKRITIRTRYRKDARLGVIAEVEDNGIGVESVSVGRVFEPFFTTKDINRGTGLGLSISYATVRDHGGEITCESTWGEGSTFRVELPAAEDEDDPG